MDMNKKSKITGLSAKRSIEFVNGKNPKQAITGNKIKGSKIDLPSPKSGKPMMKAKSMMK